MQKRSKKPSGKLILFFMLGFAATSLKTEAISIKVRPLTYNCSQTDANQIQFDVYVKNTGSDTLGYRAHTLRFTMNRGVLPVSPLPTGTVTYVAGTGDTRLAALQATYHEPASSFTISTNVIQINLSGSGLVYGAFDSPRVIPGDSIWLGTFRATASVHWNCDSSTTPVWLTSTPSSVEVYDSPPSIPIATVCNSNGTGTFLSSGLLENGNVTTNNPTGAGSPPCSILLSCATISTSAINGSLFCAGALINAPYTIVDSFYTGNVFTAQLSLAIDSFSNPVNMGSLSSTFAGTISATIPGNVSSGAYRIRVVSSAPPVTGSDNGNDITIIATATPAVNISANPGTTICPGTSTVFTATPFDGGSTPVYQWKKNGINVGTNSATYTDATLNNSDIIQCIMTSNRPCITTNPVTSAPLVMNVNFNVCTIDGSNISGLLCAGSSDNISFNSALSVYNPGNSFIAQLSDSLGNFSSPVVIGTLASTIPNPIPVKIPYTTLPGSGYKIRVVSSNPLITGTPGSAFVIRTFTNSITESMGIGAGGTTTIASHEAANGFDNDNLTMTGTAEIRSNPPVSSGYPEASANACVSFPAINSIYFQIEGINTAATSIINRKLSFGIYKNTTASNGSNLVVEVSSNGSSYTLLSFPALPTGSGSDTWYYRTATGTIAAAANLRIRFRQTSTSTQFRIDDVKFSFTDTAASISPLGATTFCIPGSVTLLATVSSAYSWSNGAATQSIVASNTDSYRCSFASDNGCALKSNSIAVLATSCAISLNLKTFFEGFFIPGTDSMHAVVDPVNYPGVCDSITCSLADSASLQIVATNKNVISTHGAGVFNFTGLLPGHRYYLVIRHRNSLETWSKYSFLFDNPVLTIDFTH